MRLTRCISLGTVWMLPEWSKGPVGDVGPATFETVAGAGYVGIQVFSPEHVPAARAAGLDTFGIGRADDVAALRDYVQRWEGAGVSAVSTHLGTGFESDPEARELVAAFVELTSRSPTLFTVETHRATVTQDPARTLALLADAPSIRVTADLAHWYLGCEMTYGGFDWKVPRLAPVLARTRIVHARTATNGSAQVPLPAGGERPPFVDHFTALWRAMFEAVVAGDDAPDEIPFIPELLPPHTNYGKLVPGPDGALTEETDRWLEADRLYAFADAILQDVIDGAAR